jgi:hypothetical protein
MARRRGLGERKPSGLLTDDAGRKIAEKIFKHSGEGLAEMAAWLLAASGAAQPNLPSPSKRRTARGGNADQAWLHNPCYQSEADGSLRFTLAGAKDDSRDAEAMASALRTNPPCFRLLAALDPTVLELRAWSRIASDLGASWLLWEIAPAPGKATRIREGTAAKVLKRHRSRRFDAAHVLDVLRKPPERRKPPALISRRSLRASAL